MKCEQQDFQVLALGFIQQTLSSEDRRRAQELVLNNPEFLKVLKLELALIRQLSSLKQPMPDSLKKHVYSSVTASTRALFCQKVFQTVLKVTMPTLAWPALQLLERSVFANE